MLNKLKFSWIRDVPLLLFYGYLSCRQQNVCCNHTYSPFQFISKGVPQGSILGPILFLLYIDDIVVKIFFVLCWWYNIFSEAQKSRFITCKFHINKKKKLLVILDSEVIKRVTSTKFPALIIDENLNWKPPYWSSMFKALKKSHIQRIVRSSRTTEAMISTYYTLC